MLFRQRRPVNLGEKVRMALWPRRSFARSAQYFAKRVLRLTATPHAIAAGVAAGVFASFTPFLGFHFMLAAIIAWLLRGNLLASAIGTVVGNPLTFPFIWAATLQAGRFILLDRHDPRDELRVGTMLRHLDFADLWGPIIKPMTIGAIPLGLAAALVFYVVTRWAVIVFRDQRRRRLAERARRRAEAGVGRAIDGAAAGP
jgi:uncharacterized protein (DUF2062 family)